MLRYWDIFIHLKENINSLLIEAAHTDAYSFADMANMTDQEIRQLLENQAGQSNDQGFQRIAYGAEAQSYRAWMGHSGFLRLYDPSDGTYMKHFQSIMNATYTGNGTLAQTYCIHWAAQGYFHTTTALTRIRFQAETGNLYTGIFSMYGLA